MAEVEEITLYRFRVRTADGRTAVSRIFATRRVPHAHLASEKEAPIFTGGEVPQEEPAMLSNPRWSEESFGHGQNATMLIDAPGLDGRTVRFRVEHRNESDWTDYETVEAKVENGVAEAVLQLHHPAPGEENAAPADLRFACELI